MKFPTVVKIPSSTRRASPLHRKIGSGECTETLDSRGKTRGENGLPPSRYSPRQSVVILRERRVSSPGRSTRARARSFRRKGRRNEKVKYRLHDPRIGISRTLRYATLRYERYPVTLSPSSPVSPDKVRSLRGSERALLPLSRNAGRRRGIVKSRVCELSTFDSSGARETARLTTPNRERKEGRETDRQRGREGEGERERKRRDPARNFCNVRFSRRTSRRSTAAEFSRLARDNTGVLRRDLMRFCETRFLQDRNFATRIPYDTGSPRHGLYSFSRYVIWTRGTP